MLPGLRTCKKVGETPTPVPLINALEIGGKEVIVPTSLNVQGQRAWKAAYRRLAQVGEIDDEMLIGMEVMAYTWQKIRKIMEADQDLPPAMLHAFRKMLIEYGLTPVSLFHLDPTGEKTRVKKVVRYGQPAEENTIEKSEVASFEELD